MPAILEYFSQEQLALSREIKAHPDLLKFIREEIKETGNSDFESKIATIAAYCEVTLDGNYLPLELDKLCVILLHKLQHKRMLIVNTINSTRNV